VKGVGLEVWKGRREGLMVRKGLGIKVGKRRKGGDKWERVMVGNKGVRV
jgi:hypothetical protein